VPRKKIQKKINKSSNKLEQIPFSTQEDPSQELDGFQAPFSWALPQQQQPSEPQPTPFSSTSVSSKRINHFIPPDLFF
jgi:hypothetical protein